jgi:hypothetical protein
LPLERRHRQMHIPINFQAQAFTQVDDLATQFHRPRAAVLSYIIEEGSTMRSRDPSTRQSHQARCAISISMSHPNSMSK